MVELVQGLQQCKTIQQCPKNAHACRTLADSYEKGIGMRNLSVLYSHRRNWILVQSRFRVKQNMQ